MGAIELLLGLTALFVKEREQYKQKKLVMDRLNSGLNADYHYDIDGNRVDNATGRRFTYGTNLETYIDQYGQTKIKKTHCYKYFEGGGKIDITERAMKKLLADARERGKRENKRFVDLYSTDLLNVMMRDEYFDTEHIPPACKIYHRFEDSRWLDMKTGAICVTDYWMTKMIHWKTGEVLAGREWKEAKWTEE